MGIVYLSKSSRLSFYESSGLGILTTGSSAVLLWRRLCAHSRAILDILGAFIVHSRLPYLNFWSYEIFNLCIFRYQS